MTVCLNKTLRSFRGLTTLEATQILKHESKRLEITKSLLNVLYNICLDSSIPLSRRLKVEFSKHEVAIQKLLEGASKRTNHTRNLQIKRKILLKNPVLIKLIAETCPLQNHKE